MTQLRLKNILPYCTKAKVKNEKTGTIFYYYGIGEFDSYAIQISNNYLKEFGHLKVSKIGFDNNEGIVMIEVN